MVDRIGELTEILPYVREFLGKTFVIKLGGEVCAGKSLTDIAKQVSLIHHIGIKVVLVHGGGPQLDALCSTLGIERHVVAGRRVTDEETLRACKMVFAGLLSTDIVAALRAQGASAAGLSGVDASLIGAVRRPPRQVATDDGDTRLVDFGMVGDIVSINTGFLTTLLHERVIPVVSSLGATAEGQVLNINADTVASALARELKADKLILLSNVPGILKDKRDPSSLVSYASIRSLEKMIADGSIRDGMLPKVQACMEAVKGGVSRTHIIDGGKSDSLLMELFLNQGCGTMIVDEPEMDRYQHEVDGR
ncbi:MAG: acetylglutamate kinase [Oligoflexia bacterium]|nr:acetylglutamate kinase [Oligoflexia bacterium]